MTERAEICRIIPSIFLLSFMHYIYNLSYRGGCMVVNNPGHNALSPVNQPRINQQELQTCLRELLILIQCNKLAFSTRSYQFPILRGMKYFSGRGEKIKWLLCDTYIINKGFSYHVSLIMPPRSYLELSQTFLLHRRITALPNINISLIGN